MTTTSSAGKPGPDIFPEDITCDNVHELRVGQIGTMKGKLENVRYSTHHQGPSLVITFADWGMLAVTLRDYHTAKGIPYPLGTYVAVKVQCVTEDGELRALAIWELGSNPVPIPLADPTHYRMIERLTTVPKPR